MASIFTDDGGINYSVTCENCGAARGMHYTDPGKKLTYCINPTLREHTKNYSKFVPASPVSTRITTVTSPDGETFDICRLTMSEMGRTACGTTLHDRWGKAWLCDIAYDSLGGATVTGTVRDALTDYGFRFDNENYKEYHNYHLQDILDNEMIATKPVCDKRYHRMACNCIYDESTGKQIQACGDESHRQGKVIQEGLQWIPVEIATPDETPHHYICIDKAIKDAPQYYWWDGNQFPFVNERVTHWLDNTDLIMPSEEPSE
jgi:hypothetical protein